MMRVVDIGVAVAVGLLSLYSLSVMDPSSLSEASHTYSVRSGLSRALLDLLLTKGVYWFEASSFTQICAYVSSATNATAVFSAKEDGVDCVPRVSSPEPVNLTLSFELRTVVLEAWQAGQ